jgi:hypothetical protein
MIRGELNRHSLQEEIARRNLNYASYIQNRDMNPYVQQAATYELNRPSTSTTFYSTMSRHSEEINKLHGTFHPYSNPYENLFDISKEDQRKFFYETFHDTWKTRIQQSTKADTYKQFKENMKFEPYLLHKNRKERVTMTKLRCSDHKLQIEVGRWHRPPVPRPERKCPMCSEMLEDEVHFLTNCTLYGSYDKFWNEILDITPSLLSLSYTDLFIYVMTQEDHEITKIALKMVNQWMKLRVFLQENFYQE